MNNLRQITEGQEHRINAQIARLESMTAREQLNPRHDPTRWGAVLLRESIGVFLLAGVSRGHVAAILRAIANDVTHGRPLRPSEHI